MNSSVPLSGFFNWQLVKMSAKLSFKFKDSLEDQIDEIRDDQKAGSAEEAVIRHRLQTAMSFEK